MSSVAPVSKIAPIEPDIFDDDDDGWQDMPVVRDDTDIGLDEEDQKKYHYRPPDKKDPAARGESNATGNLLDVDFEGTEWRSKTDQNENDYTRLRVNEEDESDEVHLRTRYLFDEDKAMTPLSQMQATKDLLTEAQRIAYVGLCALTSREMSNQLKAVRQKELKKAIQSMELWALKIMGRLYYHMELATEEQKMIDSLALHGIEAKDLVPSLMTTHTIANPEYDPVEAKKQAEIRDALPPEYAADDESGDISDISQSAPPTPTQDTHASPQLAKPVQTTAKVFEDTSASVPGVSTHLSSADEIVTLDIRWTVLCDLFLILIADSVYDARSRVLLENVAIKLGLGWLDVVKFERRVTEALEIQEDVDKLESQDAVVGVQKNSRKRRFVMMGLATLGGGLVIGLSAGLLAPVIGAGLVTALGTVGISGTAGFLAGAGGAAVITTGGVLTGSGIAARGMANRTQYVRTFDILPLHNNKRVNCILTVSGFMSGAQDDVRLPFSVLDPVVGDVFSVLWEPEMIRETGSALKILTSEVLSQIGQTVLQATVMTALMSALQWPIILTKLGYLIDNPWSNALDRAKSAGSVLADILIHRQLGVRPITLIGFSLGARVIFYALLELAKQKAFGIVQDVFLLGTTVTAPTRTWLEVRSAVSGRFVNGFARNDWVLNYLFRATSGGLNTVAGLRPVENVPGLENVDVTDKISGHMSYRTFMPLILDQLGFPVSADYFDEPEEPDFEGDRIVVREGEEENKKKSWFSRKKKSTNPSTSIPTSGPPSTSTFTSDKKSAVASSDTDDELPPRDESATPLPPYSASSVTPVTAEVAGSDIASPGLPPKAGFDFGAIKEVLGKAELDPQELQMPVPRHFGAPLIPPPTLRSESAPYLVPDSPVATPKARASLNLDDDVPVAGPSALPRHDLTSTFSRSISLSNIRDADEAEGEAMMSSDRKASSTGVYDIPAFRNPAALSFGNSDGTLWPSEPDPPSSYSGFGAYSNRSTISGLLPNESLSFGTASTLGTYAQSSLPNNLYPSSATSLSFGDATGAIISYASHTEQEPWDIGVRGLSSKKSSSTLNLNPWQS